MQNITISTLENVFKNLFLNKDFPKENPQALTLFPSVRFSVTQPNANARQKHVLNHSLMSGLYCPDFFLVPPNKYWQFHRERNQNALELFFYFDCFLKSL